MQLISRQTKYRRKMKAMGKCVCCRKKLDRAGVRCRKCNRETVARAKALRHSMRISNDGA